VTGGATASFGYDGDGNRITATFGANTTVYIGDYYEKTGATVKTYYHQGGQRVAMRDGSTRYWLLVDHLGSTALTTNASGSKTGELRYKAYGANRYTYGTTPTTYHFTGQREDVSIGLYYYGARYYDPYAGRFIQPDTLVPNPKNPQDLNRYSYVRNNPLKYRDPTGHSQQDQEPGTQGCDIIAVSCAMNNEYQILGTFPWYYNNVYGTPCQDSQADLAFARDLALRRATGQNRVVLDPQEFMLPWITAGQMAFNALPLTPEAPIVPGWPTFNLIQLSGQAAEMNAWFALGWDYGTAVLTTGGWFMVGLGTLAGDPSTLAFGYGVAQVGSLAATVTLLDTLLTSGPNSEAMAVSATSYTFGWSSAVWNAPADMIAAWAQVAYDYYTLQRIQAQNQGSR